MVLVCGENEQWRDGWLCWQPTQEEDIAKRCDGVATLHETLMGIFMEYKKTINATQASLFLVFRLLPASQQQQLQEDSYKKAVVCRMELI